jgi:hypothetical protein
METLKKVTVMLPAELLARATAATGKGTTATIREGLESVAVAESYEALRRLRGKVKFSRTAVELRHG